jgi:hypothetical protein
VGIGTGTYHYRTKNPIILSRISFFTGLILDPNFSAAFLARTGAPVEDYEWTVLPVFVPFTWFNGDENALTFWSYDNADGEQQYLSGESFPVEGEQLQV